MRTSKIKYPYAYIDFEGEQKVLAPLDSAEFIYQFVTALKTDPDFADAIADFWGDLDSLPTAWEDTTFEDIAIGMTDDFKANYREWKSLSDRGREDNDWIIISEDESVVVSRG